MNWEVYLMPVALARSESTPLVTTSIFSMEVLFVLPIPGIFKSLQLLALLLGIFSPLVLLACLLAALL